MKVKGKRILITDDAVEFARTVRGQYIISQALVFAHKILKGYEDEVDKLLNEGKPIGDIPNRYLTRQEPSNRSDMEYLLQAYPLYQIHNPEIWEILKKVEEDYEND